MRNWLNTWDWEDSWNIVLLLAVIGLSIVIGMFIFTDKQIRYYYLSDKDGKMRIIPDIDWCEDSSYGIDLQRNVTYEEALQMVSQMNAELKENKKEVKK